MRFIRKADWNEPDSSNLRQMLAYQTQWDSLWLCRAERPMSRPSDGWVYRYPPVQREKNEGRLLFGKDDQASKVLWRKFSFTYLKYFQVCSDSEINVSKCFIQPIFSAYWQRAHPWLTTAIKLWHTAQYAMKQCLCRDLAARVGHLSTMATVISTTMQALQSLPNWNVDLAMAI